MERRELQKKLLQSMKDNLLPCRGKYDGLSAAELDKINLHNDMLLDSFDCFELSLRIEKDFGVALTDEEVCALGFKNFGEITDIVLFRLKN